jgi:LuxR family maltose regulon positive regulatory protein
LLPEKELSVRAFAFKTLGSAHLQCDDLENAYRAYQESIALGRASDNAQVYVLASANLANLFLKRGQLGNVEQICAEVFSFVKNDPAKQTPAIAQIYAMQTDVFWGRYELEKALDTARAGLEICKQWNQLDTLTVCYLSLIDVLITLGNFDEAALELAKLKKLGMNVSAWIKSIIEEEEALLSLAVGDITAAARWAGESGLDYRDVVPETKRTTYRTLAQALWRQGKNTEAVTLLDRLATEAENSGAKGYLLGLLPLQSLVHFSSGNKDQALAVLEQALTLAEPVGYKRMYADLGEPMAKLLHLAIKQAVHPAYAARLVELIEERQARRQGWQWPERESHPAARNKLPEPLSDRELQVLRLLDSPLTGEEISRELYVSVSTTRTHLRNIYGKLGVHGRLEALQKAKALGLI